jgi:hypothetical protein
LYFDSSNASAQLPLSARRILISFLSFKDLTTLNSFLLTLVLEDLDFYNMDLIFHLNSIPRVCGSFETTDSTAYTMSGLECGYVTEKFQTFLKTASSESVRGCFERVRTNFMKPGVATEETLFC